MMLNSLREFGKAKLPPRLRGGLRGTARRLEELIIRTSRFLTPAAPKKTPDGRILLNLGCGYTTHPAFTNVDALAAWHVHYIRPVNDLRPFADGSVDLVYVSHCLEHFSHRKVGSVLMEWHRVLKPGGVLRLGVPDFDALLEVYEASGRDMDSIQGYLMGGQDYPLNFHQVSFNRSSLTRLLLNVGFQEVRPWLRDVDELTSLPDCTALTVKVGDRVIGVSLNLEAIK
jgi:predicted SAM-dependent methyltransferase